MKVIEAKATLVKVADNVFEGNHPNGIIEGYTKKANRFTIPVVGERYQFSTLKTTPVVEIVELEEGHIKFTTWNSTYLLTY